MKILVCGGRDFTNRDKLFKELDEIERDFKPITAVVHGDCRGADKFGGEWATARDKPVFPVPALWDVEGRAAGMIRNAKMLEQHPDIELLVAFEGGRGTQDMINKARGKGITLVTFGKAGITTWQT